MSDEYVTLSEFDLEVDGTVVSTITKSPEGIRTPTADYEQGLLDAGPIVRQIGPGSESYSVSSMSAEFANENRQYSILKNGFRFRGRKQKYKVGLLADGLAQARQLFVGAVEDWNITSNARVRFVLKDAGIDRFKKPLRELIGSINVATFPDLPSGRAESLIPIPYGDISTNGGGLNGAGPMPAYLIDPDAGGKWRYLAAGAVMKSIDTTFVYGNSAHGITTTVSSQTYGGRSMTVIDFDSDPRDPDRPNEIEVTFLGKGITDDGTTGGNLITNVAEQAKHFLINYAGFDASQIDDDLMDAAIAAADNNLLQGTAAPYQGVVWVGGENLNRRVIDILNEMTRSWLMYFWMTTENKIGAFLLTLTEAENPAGAALAVNNSEIAKGSFRVYGNRDVYSTIDYQAVHNWTLDKFGLTVRSAVEVPSKWTFPVDHSSWVFPVDHDDWTFPTDYDDTATSVLMLGDQDTPEAPARMVEMEYVADPDTALSVASVYGMLASERVEFCEFELPQEYLLNAAADLNRYIAITHWQGISSTGGYQDALFRIVRTEAYIMPKQKRLKIVGIRIAA